MTKTNEKSRRANNSSAAGTSAHETCQLPNFHNFLDDARSNSSCLDASCETILETVSVLLLLEDESCLLNKEKLQIIDLCKRLVLVKRDLTDIKREYLVVP